MEEGLSFSQLLGAKFQKEWTLPVTMVDVSSCLVFHTRIL